MLDFAWFRGLPDHLIETNIGVGIEEWNCTCSANFFPKVVLLFKPKKLNGIWWGPEKMKPRSDRSKSKPKSDPFIVFRCPFYTSKTVLYYNPSCIFLLHNVALHHFLLHHSPFAAHFWFQSRIFEVLYIRHYSCQIIRYIQFKYERCTILGTISHYVQDRFPGIQKVE